MPSLSSTLGQESISLPPLLSPSVSSRNAKRPHGALLSRRPTLRRRRRVSIESNVTVVPIPSRAEYGPQARERLWSSADELYRNAARNALEFASEGWHWRTVVEDDDMLVHSVSGELIHPVHLRNVLEMAAESGEGDEGAGNLTLPLLPNTRGAGSIGGSCAPISTPDSELGADATGKGPAQLPCQMKCRGHNAELETHCRL